MQLSYCRVLPLCLSLLYPSRVIRKLLLIPRALCDCQISGYIIGVFHAFLLQQQCFASVPVYYYPVAGSISLQVAEKRLVLGRAVYDLYRWGTSLSFL